MKERIKHLILFLILVGIDQGSKFWVRTCLQNKNPLIIIPNRILNFQYHENTGAVWGILSGRIDFLKIFTLIVLVFILFVYFKIPQGKRYQILKILSIFIMAGAVGNLIDRFYLGHVVDFIYFEIIDFPLFNFADSCLTVSSILLFLFAMFYYKDEDFAFLGTAFQGKKRVKEEMKDSEEDEASEDAVNEGKVTEDEVTGDEVTEDEVTEDDAFKSEASKDNTAEDNTAEDDAARNETAENNTTEK